MIRLITILGFLSFGGIALSSQNFYNSRLDNTDGESVQLKDVKGKKLTVLDFWATWCKPCIKAIPELIELSDKYSDSDVAFVGINVDSPRNRAKVKPFSASLGITYPVLLDIDQVLSSELMIGALPTLIILNSTGEIVFTHQGYAPGDEKIIEHEIEKNLASLE